MSRKYFTFLLLPFVLFESLNAEAVECNIITGGTRECNPYVLKFVKTKEIEYDRDRKKLIVTKTLPVPEKKSSVQVVSVEDMIEKYVKVEDSMRFKGNEPVLGKEIEEVIRLSAIEKIRLSRKKLFDEMIKEKEEKRLEALKIAEEKKKAYFDKVKKFTDEQEKKRLETLRLAEEKQKEELEKQKKELEEQVKKYGSYVIESGDGLSTIAAKFRIKTKVLQELNHLKKKSLIRIGKKLIIPYEQKKSGCYFSCRICCSKGRYSWLYCKRV